MIITSCDYILTGITLALLKILNTLHARQTKITLGYMSIINSEACEQPNVVCLTRPSSNLPAQPTQTLYSVQKQPKQRERERARPWMQAKPNTGPLLTYSAIAVDNRCTAEGISALYGAARPQQHAEK